jgi:hypothetical protein
MIRTAPSRSPSAREVEQRRVEIRAAWTPQERSRRARHAMARNNSLWAIIADAEVDGAHIRQRGMSTTALWTHY